MKTMHPVTRYLSLSAAFALSSCTLMNVEERVGAPSLTECVLPGVERTALCGSMSVPESWEDENGKQIQLAVVVIPALSADVEDDPIIPLMGGPGESAIEAASYFVDQLAPLLNGRDLVLIDQRGAGESSPLECDLTPDGRLEPLLTDFFPANAITECATFLGNDVDLTAFGYSSFAKDVEHVRDRLGYGELNLFAGSYGTRALQVYLRDYPDNVRTAYINSVVPIDIVTPLTMAATAKRELDRLFEDCEADDQCNNAFPDLRRQFAVIMRRLDDGEVYVPARGIEGTHRLARGPVASWMRARLYRPSSAAILPLAISEAYNGNWDIVRDGVLAHDQSDLSFGLFFAITCNEDMKFVTPEDLSSVDDGFVGSYRVRQQLAACETWPTSALPEGYRDPLRSDVPTIFSTGEHDGGTPAWFTDHAARGFSNAIVIKTPFQGHTEWNECVAMTYYDLVRTGNVAAPANVTCETYGRPSFLTSLIDER